MEGFSYKGRCGVHGCTHISRCLKEELAQATDKWCYFSLHQCLLGSGAKENNYSCEVCSYIFIHLQVQNVNKLTDGLSAIHVLTTVVLKGGL